MLRSLLLLILSVPFLVQGQKPVILDWLGGRAPAKGAGVSWGVPWPEGAVNKEQAFTLLDGKGRTLPLQSWPMAYWPDGSLKWSGFATVTDTGMNGALKLVLAGAAAASKEVLQVSEDAAAIHINTGAMQCLIPKSGNVLLDSVRVGGRVVACGGQLVCIRQNGPDGEVYDNPPAREKFLGEIDEVTLEQAGEVRAVVRVKGRHRSVSGDRSWLPFDVRLYFYHNLRNIRLVHTILYDGNEREDFVKGLGLEFAVPMREELHNRHVRFAGEGPGMWDEPVHPLVGRRRIMFGEQPVYEKQVAGKRLPDLEEFDERNRGLARDLAFWNDYRLTQNTADGFMIRKRTNSQSSWLDANGGKRASGLVFAGDVSGGLAVGVKNFWQSYPGALEVHHAAMDTARLRVWLWSPYAEAMDMRHYDTVAHGLEASYEDVQPGFSTAHGVGRTSELVLYPTGEVPSNALLSGAALDSRKPPMLVCSPEYLHSAGVFGVWSLPDRSTPGKRWIEDKLDKALAFYKLEIEQRNWYGFWDYGDVMHAYDPQRHSWRYDVGGFAWANTELMPDMWLWYSFLRTGRADVFRMAEAMTRHTGEVDVYHLGRFAGLGSRHNVSHWGCGAKEVRISQAALRRFYYYLTTDERAGDLMHEAALNAGKAIERIDPLRLILEASEYPTHARVGPDWLALAGNWMTEWERTGDPAWKNKILAGIKSFSTMPYGLFSGKAGAFGYDNSTNELYMLGEEDIGSSHLSVLMGGPEVAFELSKLLDSPEWDRLWQQFCRLYGAPREKIAAELGKNAKLGDMGAHFARLPAYLAMTENDPETAAYAWDAFLNARYGGGASMFESSPVPETDAIKPTREVPRVSTNNTAQWCLNAIELLEMIGDSLPEEHPLWEKN